MKRVQFELTEMQAEHLKMLMSQSEVSSKRELFNNALTLLEWAIEEVGNNRKIASVSEDGQTFKEITMPIFTSVRQRRPSPLASAN